MFGEARRLQIQNSDIEATEIASHVNKVVADACSLKKRPEKPENFVRTMSVNLAKRQLIKRLIKAKELQDALEEKERIAEFARVQDAKSDDFRALEARDMAEFFLSKLPAEAVSPFSMATRNFYRLVIEGMKRKELLFRYPSLTLNEIRHHQAVIRETRETWAAVLEREF